MIWGGIIRLQLYILYVSKAIYLTEITYLLFHWYSIKSMTKKKKPTKKHTHKYQVKETDLVPTLFPFFS